MLLFLLQISLLDTEGVEEHGSYMFLLQISLSLSWYAPCCGYFCVDWPKLEDPLNAGQMIHLRQSFIAAGDWFFCGYIVRCSLITRRFWFSF